MCVLGRGRLLCKEFQDAGAVIHTHPKYAVLATLCYPATEFRISHQKMIKGTRKGFKGEFWFSKIHVVNHLIHIGRNKL